MRFIPILCFVYGHMAELVDALVSGTSGSNTLEVRVFLCPPNFPLVMCIFARF